MFIHANAVALMISFCHILQNYWQESKKDQIQMPYIHFKVAVPSTYYIKKQSYHQWLQIISYVTTVIPKQEDKTCKSI